MRFLVAFVVVSTACGPKLPPVSGAVDRSVDHVPSQARAELLRARLALDAGQAERALVAARRAANLDSSAAAPWALIGQAECLRGDLDAAILATTEGLGREPEVIELRVQRFELTGAEGDLAWLETTGALTRPWVAVSLAASSTVPPSSVVVALRHRLSTDVAGELSALLRELIRVAESPAVVVAALRLDASGLLPTALLPDVMAAVDDLGVPPDLLPQEWRQPHSADSEARAVGYSLDPVVAAGWQAAREGRLDEATAQLAAAWQEEPSKLVLRELLWLIQGPSPVSFSSDFVQPAQPVRPECR